MEASQLPPQPPPPPSTSLSQQRLDWLDFDVHPDPHHDEELPDYSTATAPAYDSGTYHDPLVTYSLRRYDRKIQLFLALGNPSPSTASSASSYRVTTNSFRVFSHKPEMEVLHTSPAHRQRNIALISFDKDGPLPWCPRAHFSHADSGTVAMEARNFEDWTFTFGDQQYRWSLSTCPCALELSAVESRVVSARFTYSGVGTMATRGEEVGRLVVWRDGLTCGGEGVDVVVCSFMVALTYLKKQGKQYKNARRGSEGE